MRAGAGKYDVWHEILAGSSSSSFREVAASLKMAQVDSLVSATGSA